MKKDSQGITLIALVITIIVLLILAGISIASITGENGVLTKANDAKEKSVEGEEKEQIKLAYNAALTEKLEKEDSSNVTEGELQGELDNLKAEATAQGTNPIKVTFSKTKHIYEVNNKGNVEVSPGSNTNKRKCYFTLAGVSCYFECDPEEENPCVGILSWIREHVTGAEIVMIGAGENEVYIGDKCLVGGVFESTLVYEGDEIFGDNIEDLESRIHYD